jgi:mono/diheme cytochrome c family protein
MSVVAYWNARNIILVTLFIVAFPAIPLAIYFSGVLRRRRPEEVGDGGSVRRGTSPNTPIAVLGWVGLGLTALVLLGVGLAVAAQRATDSHPGNPVQRGAATNVNRSRDPMLPPQGNAEAGGRLFASSGCGGCHTLRAARAKGKVGPNLDTSRPDFTRVVECVVTGPGDMPSFSSKLTPAEIRNVAAFVVAVGTGDTDRPGGEDTVDSRGG